MKVYFNKIINIIKQLLGFLVFGYIKKENRVKLLKYLPDSSINEFRLFIGARHSDWKNLRISIVDENIKTPYEIMETTWIKIDEDIPNKYARIYVERRMDYKIKIAVTNTGIIRWITIEGHTPFTDLCWNIFVTGFGLEQMIDGDPSQPYLVNFLIGLFLICLVKFYILITVYYELKIAAINLEHLSHIYSLELKQVQFR